MKLITNKLSIFVIALIALINVGQFHYHDCIGAIKFFNFSEQLHHHHVHENNHNHEHKCNDDCPVEVIEGIRFNYTSLMDFFIHQYVFDVFIQGDINAVEAPLYAKLTLLCADTVIPINIWFSCSYNRYRGSPCCR